MGFKNIFYPLKSVQENLVFGSAVASYIVIYFAYESLYLTVLFIKTLQWLYIFNFRKLRVGQNIFFSTYHCFLNKQTNNPKKKPSKIFAVTLFRGFPSLHL